MCRQMDSWLRFKQLSSFMYIVYLHARMKLKQKKCRIVPTLSLSVIITSNDNVII